MKFGKQVLAETVTDRDGAFFLPEPERRRRTVVIHSEEWRTTPASYRLDEDQGKGLTELVFEAQRIVAAPLRGRLLDQATGEPVPDYLIRVQGPRGTVLRSESDPDADQPAVSFELHAPPRRVESITTGQDGRFESAGGFEAGLLELVLVDHPSLLDGATPPAGDNTLEHAHAFGVGNAPQDAEIRIVVGPTYRLDVVLPGGTSVADFYATFPEPLEFLRYAHRTVSTAPGTSVALYYGSLLQRGVLEQQAPLREGPRIWTRFRGPVALLEPSDVDPPVLHVRSRDGHWSGTAPVSSIEGICPEVVPITLQACGSVAGTVLDGKGKPVPSAWLRLFAASAPATPRDEVGADRRGRFTFEWLAEGEYEVVVETDRYAESRSALAIVKGATQRLEIRLTAETPLGTVSGALRSRTGQHHSKGAIVSLRSLDNPEFSLIGNADYRKRKGEYTAPFSFEDVPSGSYELRIEPLDNMRWETRTMTISAPAEGLEFMCADAVPTFDLELRALDAQTGSPIEQTWNIVWQGDPLEDVRLDEDWETGIYEGVPEGVPLRWVLRAKGFRLASGNETAIRREANQRVIAARLERGWGQIFKVTTREAEPIEGVELLADGVTLGRTDAQGSVAMDLDAKPRRLEFRYEDWIVTWGTVDPNDDSFGWGPETPVYMGPRP